MVDRRRDPRAEDICRGRAGGDRNTGGVFYRRRLARRAVGGNAGGMRKLFVRAQGLA